MDSAIFSTVLPIVVAVVMFGLGLELTRDDFGRVLVAPRAVLTVLACQIVILPLLGTILLIIVNLPSPISLGVVVLLASPGGAMAAVFSHLAGGDVALNISATALNAAVSLVTMPLVIGVALRYIDAGDSTQIAVPPDKVIQVILVVLVPVAAGMILRKLRRETATTLRRPVRVISIVVVFCSILAAVAQEAAGFLHELIAIGLLVLVLSIVNLTVGYLLPRLLKLHRRQAIAASLEVGIHNVALAITICVTVIDNSQAAVVPAMYGALMFGPAAMFAWLLSRSSGRRFEDGNDSSSGPL